MAHSKQASDGDGDGLAGSSFKGSSSSFCRTSFESTSSGSAGSSSPYFSTRCQSLAQQRGESNLSELEFGIEVSKEHWSELSSVVEPQRKAAGGFLGRVLLGRKVEQKKLHSAESLEQIREVFERLKNGRHSFFQDFDDLVLRRKIAEGGQAEIFEAECTLPTCGGPPAKAQCIVKVRLIPSTLSTEMPTPHICTEIEGWKFAGDEGGILLAIARVPVVDEAVSSPEQGMRGE